MSVVAPASSASRGDIVLQPSYFTSSLYVEPLRTDIDGLIDLFHTRYIASPSQPFRLFKSIWISHGWKWLHFRVFDNRTRKSFLDVTLRLFLERTTNSNALHAQVAALFGFYTFFYTQPLQTRPPLYHVKHIAIPIDHYKSLYGLASALESSEHLTLRPAISMILSKLKKDNIFFIVPHSSLFALDPRELPRERVSVGPAVADPDAPKKKGRPARRDKVAKAKSALDELDKFLDRDVESPLDDQMVPEVTLAAYRRSKRELLEAVAHTGPSSGEHEALRDAKQFVMDRLDTAREERGDEETSETETERRFRERMAMKDVLEHVM